MEQVVKRFSVMPQVPVVNKGSELAERCFTATVSCFKYRNKDDQFMPYSLLVACLNLKHTGGLKQKHPDRS
jgi:hypothetical protein